MTDSVYIIYDGDCPFCSHCAKALKIKKAIGELHLINARNEDYQAFVGDQKFDLNAGMLVILNGKFYHGAEAAHLLALISTPSDLFNRLNFLFFHKLYLAKFFYPIFRFLRNLLLKIRGIRPIG
jgi:predicted DCC family thiol-disulfide oxidoreductase YuxK